MPREEHETFVVMHLTVFAELESHESIKVVMDKTAKLFPTYLMNPGNRETF